MTSVFLLYHVCLFIVQFIIADSRIIRDKGACGDKWNEENKGALLEMIAPTSIILGCKVTFNFEKKFHNYCKTNQINLYKMEKDLDNYELNKKQILKFED